MLFADYKNWPFGLSMSGSPPMSNRSSLLDTQGNLMNLYQMCIIGFPGVQHRGWVVTMIIFVIPCALLGVSRERLGQILGFSECPNLKVSLLCR